MTINFERRAHEKPQPGDRQHSRTQPQHVTTVIQLLCKLWPRPNVDPLMLRLIVPKANHINHMLISVQWLVLLAFFEDCSLLDVVHSRD